MAWLGMAWVDVAWVEFTCRGLALRGLRRRDMDVLLARHEFVAGDHRAKVVPAGSDDLRDVNHKKQHITDRQGEVLSPGPRVSAQQAGEPSKLDRLIDRQSGEQRAGP